MTNYFDSKLYAYKKCLQNHNFWFLQKVYVETFEKSFVASVLGKF